MACWWTLANCIDDCALDLASSIEWLRVSFSMIKKPVHTKASSDSTTPVSAMYRSRITFVPTCSRMSAFAVW